MLVLRYVTGRTGGVKGDRTPDLGIANAALSQLSYHPDLPRHDGEAIQTARPASRHCTATPLALHLGIDWNQHERRLLPGQYTLQPLLVDYPACRGVNLADPLRHRECLQHQCARDFEVPASGD
jgi:hypothetical protein